MNRQFHDKRQSLTITDKQAGVGKFLTDQKKFTGHMFNIKLEEKPYKISFKALPVKIQRSKNRLGARCVPHPTPPPPGEDRVKAKFFT